MTSSIDENIQPPQTDAATLTLPRADGNCIPCSVLPRKPGCHSPRERPLQQFSPGFQICSASNAGLPPSNRSRESADASSRPYLPPAIRSASACPAPYDCITPLPLNECAS